MTSKLTQLTQQKTAAQIQTMSKESFKWFTKKISELRNPSRLALPIKQETDRRTRRTLLGGLYCFYYDPKTKDDMPYYDRFPMVIILQRYPDGFLGLNLHYLPIKYRVAFMDKLMQYAVYNDEDEIKRLRVTYDILSASRRFREFKPCLKRYLLQHITSPVLTVKPEEWETAVFLPCYQFKGATPAKVWQESVQEIRKS